MITSLRALLQTALSPRPVVKSQLPIDRDLKETRYKGHVIRFKRETEFWVSRTFSPSGDELFPGDRVTATLSEGPEILIARTRRRITAMIESTVEA